MSRQQGAYCVDYADAFGLAVRGYDIASVDALVRRVEAAVVSQDPAARAEAAEMIRLTTFPIRFRGYHRRTVNRYLNQVMHELGARQ